MLMFNNLIQNYYSCDKLLNINYEARAFNL